ncbi:ABC transporter ATP-binding protein [Nonomuraea cavernae]|uniref:ABC transporter ATP-binding protein n=1 Tax=Nonomuraea cavernae TaxID=2045107 RepID=A0A918DPB4_9ACTN|nr:ABC transporter ATP-binding protein [Nonomuraea cavernae]MCA2189209.1 ABC transporter ATP-binding protein/permease [Nonomuraea cavernae]GGO76717.1 ABC transporter ATP-binding protein [Nonomuraea cavernae]
MLAGDRLVMRAVRRNGPWTAILAVTAVGGAAAELALPYVAGRTVDAFLATDPAAVEWLAGCAAIVACVVLCESLGVWAGGVSGARAAARLRLGMLRHLLGAGPAVTRRFPEGELVTRAGLNAEEVGRAPESVTGALALLVPTVGALVALTLIAPVLTLTLFAGIVLILLVLNTFLRATTTIAGGYQKAQGELAAGLVEALGGARTIAAAGTEGLEARRVLRPLPRLRRHGLLLWRANATAGVRAGLVVPLVEVAVLAVGGFMLAAGDLTVGELYASARYAVLGAALSGALGPIGGLARARAAAGRMAEVLAVPRTRHGSRALPSGTGTVEFRDVTAAGLTVPRLVISGGSLTAVVGRSGSGKSLLAALAARLADPDGGTVLLDGVPLPELARPELRRAVGCAFERPVLVGDTIADAIALGRGLPDDAPPASGDAADVASRAGGDVVRPAAELDAVAVAAGAARADGFVRRLPHGYATRTADAPLSGGERQRLGLARAFAQGERLLVLDDATSSLDTVTEREVGRALSDGPGGRTRLVVAHRLATAARADQVVWLEDGAVRGRGPHRELWRDPAYRAVFQGDLQHDLEHDLEHDLQGGSRGDFQGEEP